MILETALLKETWESGSNNGVTSLDFVICIIKSRCWLLRVYCYVNVLLGRKVMTNLDSIFKSRNIILPKNVRLVKAVVFPVVMYGCESWSVKKAECWKIDAFELWCWRRLESPLDCKEIQPVHSKGDQSWVFIERTDAETNSNTLATSCEELTHWKRLWCWEGLGAGGEGVNNRGWDGWMASLTRWTWVCVNSGSWWWTGRPGMLWFMGSQRVGHDWVTELTDWLTDWSL